MYTQAPSRHVSVAGSLVGLSAIVVGTLTVTMTLDLALSSIVAGVEGQSHAFPPPADVVQALGVGLLVFATWAAVGFLLGTLARGPALSVGLGLVWALVLENLLRGVGALLPWMEKFTDLLPGTAAGSLVGSTITGPNDTPGVIDAISGGRATWTLITYLALVPLATLVLARRRDVT